PACREDAEPLHSAEVVLRARSPGREAEMKGDESYRDSQSHAGSLWQRCQRRDDRERGAERRYPHVGRIHVRRQEEHLDEPGNEEDEPARRRTEPRSCGLREPRGSYGDAREGEGHYAHADVPGWRPARGIQRSYGGRDVATEGLQGGERCERHPVSHGAAVRRPHRIPAWEEHEQEQQLRGDVAPSHDPEWGDLPRESAPIASALPQHRHRAHDGGEAHRVLTAEQADGEGCEGGGHAPSRSGAEPNPQGCEIRQRRAGDREEREPSDRQGVPRRARVYNGGCQTRWMGAQEPPRDRIDEERVHEVQAELRERPADRVDTEELQCHPEISDVREWPAEGAGLARR